MLSLMIVTISFIMLLILGVPIAFSLGLSGIVGIFLIGKPQIVILLSIFQGIDSWVLLAVPSFIFAGTLMERCGISSRLIDFARSLVGWIRGGLGMTTVVGEILFSGVSGSTLADTSAIGSMMSNPMVERGYKPEHVVSIVSAATCLGILIPPAIFMIVIGTMTGTSVVGIFLGAVFPGLVAGAILLMTIYLQALRFDWPYDKKPKIKEVFNSFKRALIALFMPVVILGGFRYGAFTATEAGAVCAFYAVIVAWVLYRNVTIKEMMQICLETALMTVAMLFLLGSANIYQYFLAIIGAPDFFTVLFKKLSAINFLFIVSFITLMFGLVMEGLPAAVILLPVAFPIAVAKGINPIHFCVVMTLGCSIGLFLPPTGAGLLIALKLGKLELSRKFILAYVPYVITMLVCQIIIILFPFLSLILPSNAGIK